jgi:HAD superfamily hydrolase (TIGR01662 family)
MPTIKALLFDLGNTLMYFDGQWPQVFSEADRNLLKSLRSQGYELPENEFLSEFRRRLNEYYLQRDSEFIEHTTGYVLQSLLNELGKPTLTDQQLTAGLRALYEVSQAHWHVTPYARRTLASLQDKGYKIGIISNASDDADVQALVDKGELRVYMDFVLSSAACGIRKPNPRIFELGLSNWPEIGLDEVVMIGDTLGADILGAQNAGIRSVWVTQFADKPGNRAHMETIMATASIENLAELPEELQQMNAGN